MRTVAMAALAALALAQDPEEEYKGRVETIDRSIADGHADIGSWLAGQQMHEWARAEFNKAVRLVPQHEKANKGLGYTIWNEAEKRWEADPAATPQTRNAKGGEEATKIWGDYQKRLDSLSKRIGGMYVELGDWCGSKAMADRAQTAYAKALENDPANKDARSKLGYTKQKDGGWLSKEEVALRKEMKEGVAKAPKGSPDASGNDVEGKLGITMKKQSSSNFIIQSGHLDQKTLEGLMQYAEHTYAMFNKIFRQNGVFGGGRQMQTILNDKAQHDNYIDRVTGGSDDEKKFAKQCMGVSGGLRPETYQGGRPLGHLEDWTIHQVAQTCMEAMGCAERQWLHEGMTYYFTRLMHDSASTSCTAMRGTGAGGDSKDYSDPTTWPILIREWLRTNKDPDIYKVFKCRSLSELRGPDTVKAWSLVEFLATEHRTKFIEFLLKLRRINPDDDEKALTEIFGWTIRDLDSRWKAYARVTFEKK